MNNWELDNLNNLMGDEEVSKDYSLMPEDEAFEEKPVPSEPEEPASEESSPEETATAESPEEDKPIEEAKAKVTEEEAGSSEQEDAVEEKEEASETPEPEMDPQEAAKLAQQTFIVQSTYKDMRKDLPDFRSGDTISVGYRVIEGSRSRIQSFEGVVIKISAGHGLDKTFTVRKISSGVGVERIFPLHSPNIDSIKVLKHGKVRRAKLYYLRSRVGKATRIKERTTR